jgi:hypothetical protein
MMFETTGDPGADVSKLNRFALNWRSVAIRIGKTSRVKSLGETELATYLPVPGMIHLDGRSK